MTNPTGWDWLAALIVTGLSGQMLVAIFRLMWILVSDGGLEMFGT